MKGGDIDSVDRVAVVAAIMGWSAATSVRMAKRYGHIGASPQRQAMKLLDLKQDANQESATLTAEHPTVQ